MRRWLGLALLAVWMALPSPAGAVTRLYFPASGAADVSPSVDTAWATTTGYTSALSFRLEQAKGSDAITGGSTIPTNGVGGTALDRQYVSDALTTGTVFTGGVTTFSMQIMIRELQNVDDIYYCASSLRVVNNNGDTQRAVLLVAGGWGAGSEAINNATFRDKNCATNFPIENSYTTVSGDRLVVETGFADDGLGDAPNGRAKYGQNATDCPADETTTTDCAGWIEFSNTFTFGDAAPSGGVAPARRAIGY